VKIDVLIGCQCVCRGYGNRRDVSGGYVPRASIVFDTRKVTVALDYLYFIAFVQNAHDTAACVRLAAYVESPRRAGVGIRLLGDLFDRSSFSCGSQHRVCPPAEDRAQEQQERECIPEDESSGKHGYAGYYRKDYLGDVVEETYCNKGYNACDYGSQEAGVYPCSDNGDDRADEDEDIQPRAQPVDDFIVVFSKPVADVGYESVEALPPVEGVLSGLYDVSAVGVNVFAGGRNGC